MTNRERALAVLNYQPCDRLPVVHFGFWDETLERWREKGLISEEEARSGRVDGSSVQNALCARLGFDFCWTCAISTDSGLDPNFEETLVEKLPDGSAKIMNRYGVIELHTPGVRSIPQEFDHVLKDRESWDSVFKPRLKAARPLDEAQLVSCMKRASDVDSPRGVYVGSLIGMIRNWVGVENLSYLPLDDERLMKEIVDTVGSRFFDALAIALTQFEERGFHFDFAHYWEDICYKSGPLVNPSVFAELCGPWYKKISVLLKERGISICSLDCDGMIDALIPIWLENGVNTMFPIEVGTWNASIAPWRAKYGRALRGVGGMNKNVFALDEAAVDAEIERLKPLVALGGFIPCPDHRIPPDAKFELVQRYCDKVRELKPA